MNETSFFCFFLPELQVRPSSCCYGLEYSSLILYCPILPDNYYLVSAKGRTANTASVGNFSTAEMGTVRTVKELPTALNTSKI